VLAELFSDTVLDFVTVTLCYNVKGDIIVVAVYASYVNMVNIKHTVNFSEMLFKLRNINTFGSFLEKNIKNFLQMLIVVLFQRVKVLLVHFLA
jgi:hypothetical protein